MKKGNVCLYLAKMDPTIICGNLQKKERLTGGFWDVNNL